MNTICCSAPGKLFLGGEYAVLNGAEAVVTAINRRAVATPASHTSYASPVLSAVQEHVARFLENEQGRSLTPVPIQVKTTDFVIGRQKIGLGSSAAVSVSACGALFELAGLPILDYGKEILDISQAAHRAAQGGRGSGADVAASAKGGTIIFSINAPMEPIEINTIQLVPVWSGRAASTSVLIKCIDEFKKHSPKAHQTCFDDLNRQSEELAQAYRSNDPSHIIAATERYGVSMERLGSASKAPIVTKEHKLTANLASQQGGAAKPSGAGGGDVAVAVFKDKESARQFRLCCIRHGLVPLDLTPGAPGICRDV